MASAHEGLGELEGVNGDMGSSRRQAWIACTVAAMCVQPEYGVPTLLPMTFVKLTKGGCYDLAFFLLSSLRLANFFSEDKSALLLLGARAYLVAAMSKSTQKVSPAILCEMMEEALGMGRPLRSLYARIKRLGGALEYFGGGAEGMGTFMEVFVGELKSHGFCEQGHRLLLSVGSLLQRIIEKDHYAAKQQRKEVVEALEGLQRKSEGGIGSEEEAQEFSLRIPSCLHELLESFSKQSSSDLSSGGLLPEGNFKRSRDKSQAAAPPSKRISKRDASAKSKSLGSENMLDEWEEEDEGEGGAEDFLSKEADGKSAKGGNKAAFKWNKGSVVGNKVKLEALQRMALVVDRALREQAGTQMVATLPMLGAVESDVAGIKSSTADSAAGVNAEGGGSSFKKDSGLSVSEIDLLYEAASGKPDKASYGKGKVGTSGVGFSIADTATSFLSSSSSSSSSAALPQTSLRDTAAKALAVGKSMESLASALRKMAQGLPYDTGIWALYRLVEGRAHWAASEAKSLSAAVSAMGIGCESGGGGTGGSSSALSSYTFLSSFSVNISNAPFRRAILRTHLHHKSSVPLLLLAAAESMLSKSSFRYALAAYSEVMRMRPLEPLPFLGCAVSSLTAAFNRSTPNPQTHSMRCCVYLSQYVVTRLVERQVKEVWTGEQRPTSLVSAALAAPLNLPPPLRASEAAYNAGRAAHQLGLPHIARGFYYKALEHGGKVEAYVSAHSHLYSPGEIAAMAGWGALDVRREAALNLALLLKDGGEATQALLVTKKYLTYL